MPKDFAALTLVLLVLMVLSRVFRLKVQGTKAMNFGQRDKTDFFILPFALLYFYIVFAAAFDWPAAGTQKFSDSEGLARTGVVFCLAGLSLFVWSLVSFGQSFRVGIDEDQPGGLITGGICL
jgi:protein-S-isoprenylcysteine O-methyltransferase Ste14